MRWLLPLCLIVVTAAIGCSQRPRLNRINVYGCSFTAQYSVTMTPENLVWQTSKNGRVQISDFESLRQFEQILAATDTTGVSVATDGFDTRILALFYFDDGRIDTVGFGRWDMLYNRREYKQVDSTLLHALVGYLDEEIVNFKRFGDIIRSLKTEAKAETLTDSSSARRSHGTEEPGVGLGVGSPAPRVEPGENAVKSDPGSTR